MKFKIMLFARNIVNPEAITDFITRISENKSDNIKSWCNSILKNYLKNDYTKLKDVTESKKTDPTWLQEAVKRKDAQKIIIDNTFEVLIERIFDYFDTLQSNSIKYSFIEAEKQTKKWETKTNLFNLKLIKGVKEILKCNNGYTWFEVTEEETLYNEGEIIQNCLRKKKDGTKYWARVEKKEIKIFTLRDSKGIGHVVASYDISKKFISQMFGKQNNYPIEIYYPFCVELVKYLKCKVHINIIKFLNIMICNNKVYDIFNLPDTLKVKGNLDLATTNIITLPKTLIVIGSLNLSFTNITKLPDTLKVSKNLNLYKSKIIRLPDTLEIGGDLNLDNSHITELPNNLNIGGTLTFNDTTITELPDNLNIGGDLNLAYTNITKLPNTLKIKGDLTLSKSNIIKLPDNFEIGGMLNLSNTKIKKLPINLRVGDLYLNYSEIMELPNDLVVRDMLHIAHTNISEIPKDVYVGKFITISRDMKVSCKNKLMTEKLYVSNG